MHKEEIFSLLKLIEKTKISQLEKVNFPEDFLPIIYFVMINYYENKICTLSNLSSFNNIPFNTAKRKINSLVNSKLIYKTERLKDGKHYIFLPTPALITIFEVLLIKFTAFSSCLLSATLVKGKFGCSGNPFRFRGLISSG